MNENYIRGINDRFIEDLKTGCLSWFLQQVKKNNELSLQFRKDYVSIYYKGGSALRIEQKKSGGYRFAFDYKYCLEDRARTRIKTLRTVEDYRDNFSLLLSEMDAWFIQNPKEERRIQQELLEHNTADFCILDIEYAGAYFLDNGAKRNFRLDMIAVHDGNIVMVELKSGGKAMGGSAGIIKHYNDACAILDNEAAKHNLLETIRNITTVKRSLGLPTAEISREPMIEILFVVFGYNENSKMLLNQIAGIKQSHPAKIIIMDSAGELDYRNAKDLFAK